MKKAFAIFIAVSLFTLSALAARHGHVAQHPVQPLEDQTSAVVSVVPATSTTAPAGLTTVNTQTTSVNSPFGFNFGDDIGSNGYNWATVATQLAILKSHSVTHLRIAYSGWNNVNSEALALQAKNDGFYVIIGGDWGTFSQDQFQTYENDVIQEAQWAQANGIPQLSLGNEQEYRLNGVTQDAWASDLRSIATAVKAVYSGTISYETSGDFATEWDSQSLGDIDLLGLNLYGGYTFNAQALQAEINAHGVAHVYVSETSCDIENVASCQSDSGLGQEVLGDAVKLHQNFPSTQIYFFTFSANGGDGVPTAWGIYDGTTLQDPLTAAEVGL